MGRTDARGYGGVGVVRRVGVVKELGGRWRGWSGWEGRVVRSSERGGEVERLEWLGG